MSERGFAKFNSTVRQYLDSRYSNCAICNKLLNDLNCTREHVIPVCILKWGTIISPELNKPEYIQSTLGSIRNGVRTCIECNTKKSTSIISPAYIRHELPYCDSEWYKSYADLYEELNPLINAYIEFIKEALTKYSNTCNTCNAYITEYTTVPRRIDYDKPRSLDNCRLLCEHCNNTDSNNHYDDARKRMRQRMKNIWGI